MVLSGPALRLMAARCQCPRPDTPDDMWLGACAEHAGVAIVHFAGFHQVRELVIASRPIEFDP